MSSHFELHPIPEHVHWGIHDASLAPVLRVASGDTVSLTSWADAVHSGTATRAAIRIVFVVCMALSSRW